MSLLLFSNCGLVVRVLHPVYTCDYTYDLTRNIKIFAPIGSEIYYDYNSLNDKYISDNFVLHGIVSNKNPYILKIHKLNSYALSISSWSIGKWDEVDSFFKKTSKELRKRNFYKYVRIKIVNNGEVIYTNMYDYFWGSDENGDFLEYIDYLSFSSLIEEYESDTKYLRGSTQPTIIDKYKYTDIVVNALKKD